LNDSFDHVWACGRVCHYGWHTIGKSKEKSSQSVFYSGSGLFDYQFGHLRQYDALLIDVAYENSNT